MKTALTFTLIFLLSLLPLTRVLPQTAEWINYTYGGGINEIHPEGDFIWVGTGGGFVKINLITGEKEFFNKGNSPLPVYATTSPNHVFDIETDSEGNKWIGTYGGLLKYDGAVWEVYTRYNSGFPGGYVFDIEIDQSGNLWIATYGRGLAVFDGTDWFVYNKENSGLPVDHLYCVEIDNNGNKWIGGVDTDTTHGLTKFDGSIWTVYNGYNSGYPGSESIRDIKFDEDGEVWCATSAGLVNFNGSAWNIYNKSNSGLPTDYTDCIFFDDEGTAWIGTVFGLTRFDGSNWFTYNSENSDIPYNHVTEIISIENDLWVGTYKGLAIFDGEDFSGVETSNSGLHDNYVNCFSRSPDGKWWFGTSDALTNFNGTEWHSPPAPDDIDNITSIVEDTGGIIWMGLEYTGLGRFDGNSFIIYDHFNSPLPNANITALTLDNNDKLWIGSELGLIKYDGTNWFTYNIQNSGLPHNEIKDVVVDSLGNKWIATDGGGLTKFTGSEWIIYNTQNSGIPGNQITSLQLDPNGGIWVGCNLGEFAFYNGIDWNVYDFQDSGYYSDVNCFYIDEDGYKWIGYEYDGIVKFKDDEVEFINAENSGLSGNRINFITSDESGNMWVGISDGGISVYKEGGITSAENFVNNTPSDFKLNQNYPNPFNPTTKISWQSPVSSRQTLKVYDILGNEVAVLVDEYKPAGNYHVEFNAEGLASGIYFYRIQAGSFIQIKKMIYLK